VSPGVTQKEIANALNEANETVKNSADPELKKQKDQAEDNLGKIDPERLRNLIKTEVVNELQKFGIKAGDLSSESQQKLDELNNNIKPEEAKQIRKETLNDAGVKALNKLISEVEQAIKSGDQKKIKSKYKELQEFTQNNSECTQNAYSQKKDIVNELLEKAKNWSSQNTNKSNNNFPTG
ncbi:13703_t:CDS:1, partial [Ambispora leptoticha]